MARQRQAVTVNQFVGGLNTEASPLNFPAQFSADEQNMNFNADGSRSRRLGLDQEPSGSIINTNLTKKTTMLGQLVVESIVGRSQYLWQNPGGSPDAQIMVVQIGSYLGMHTVGGVAISSSTLYSEIVDTELYSNDFSYAEVDGFLVVATGGRRVMVYSYDGTTVTKQELRLFVRDFWGVQAFEGNDDLTEVENVQQRPTTLTEPHVYNLRNQTFALPRVNGTPGVTSVDLIDPIVRFEEASGTDESYPSNADSVLPHLQADPNNTSSRTVERYLERDAFSELPGTSRAPSGYFIINALSRGQSRRSAEQALRDRHPTLTLSGNGVPDDATPGGASVVGSYAGRAWYAGFSGDITDGDSKSPSLSSYVMFSQFVEGRDQLNKCYQEADPTSSIDANLVDTDGGFIKISGAYGITALVPFGNSLFVLAENGVWRILGTDGDSFTATAFSVEKLYDEGCVSGRSVVIADSAIAFWGTSSILAISQNPQTRDWTVTDITEDTLLTRYNGIDINQKRVASGYYDSDENVVRWIYGLTPQARGAAREVTFSTKFNAFGENLYDTTGSGALGIVSSATIRKISGSVTLPTNRTLPVYLVLVAQTQAQENVFHYTFAYHRDTSHTDWDSLGTGNTQLAFLETGPITTGEPRLRKDVPYMTTFFNLQDGSSCLFRAKWGWTDNFTSYRWSNPREIYRPTSRTEGHTILTSRAKVRGSGGTVAFRFESQDDSPMHIYGWSFNLQATTEE